MTKLYEWIEIAWLEGPKNVDECDENGDFGESDKCDEISLNLLTKLYEWTEMTQIERPQKGGEFSENDEFGDSDKSDKISY